MNCQLLQTCSDMTLHMVEACSALLYAGPPTTKPSVLKKGVCWQGEERRGSIFDLLLFPVLVQAVGRRSVPLTFVSPAELLNKMKRSKPGASASSRSRYFASCTPRCCCFLHQASLICIHNTSGTAHLVLLMINQFFPFHDSVSPIQKDADRQQKITLPGAECIFQDILVS